jgi:hypothetical protein
VGTENITGFLQQHAGMHFTFGLVELAIFELPGEMDGYLVQPRILARTKNIDRGIVSIEDGRIIIKPPLVSPKGIVKSTTITEEKFYEELAADFPTVVARLKAFTSRLEEIDVRIRFGTKSMILGWQFDEKPWNLGTIFTSGTVRTEMVNWQADAVGLLKLSHACLKRVASLVPGAYVKEAGKPQSWFVAKGGTWITIDELLAHEDGWLAAMQEFMAAVTDALKDQ